MGLRSIVKHSYVPASRDGLARMRAHVRYIKHRDGRDLKDGERSFFNDRPGVVSKSTVLHALESSSKHDQVVAHKLVLSPGVENVYIEGYVRSVMKELGRKKGLDLTWFAVKHENTDHAHAHVVVMPRDLNGRRVRFFKADYTKIKELGDEYLIRNRYLSREKEFERKEKGKRSVTEFFGRLKDAIKAAFQVFKQQMTESKVPNVKRTSTAVQEQKFLGVAPARWQLEELRKIGEAKRKARAWKDYATPIVIQYSDGIAGSKLATYTPKTPLVSLRRLEKRYLAGKNSVSSQLSEEAFLRLTGWIRDQYREQKSTERKVAEVRSIKIELSAEEQLEVNAKSSILELRNLKLKHLKGDIDLNDIEYKALSGWLSDQQKRDHEKHLREQAVQTPKDKT